MANYTKKAIFNAFEELLLEKPFDKITVSAIVARSEISANTFYYHFRDIYDLLDQWLDRKKDLFIGQANASDSWEDYLKAFLHTMQDNPKLIYHISNSITRERLERYVFTSVESQFRDYIDKKVPYSNMSDDTRRLMTGFCCYSFLGYLLKFLWINMQTDVDASVDDLSILIHGALEAMVQKDRNAPAHRNGE